MIGFHSPEFEFGKRAENVDSESCADLGSREPGGRLATQTSVRELLRGIGKIELPFTAGEVNLVIQPGPSDSAAGTMLLDGKPVGDVQHPCCPGDE